MVTQQETTEAFNSSSAYQNDIAELTETRVQRHDNLMGSQWKTPAVHDRAQGKLQRKMENFQLPRKIQNSQLHRNNALRGKMRSQFQSVNVIDVDDTEIDTTSMLIKEEQLDNKMLLPWSIVSQLRRKI